MRSLYNGRFQTLPYSFVFPYPSFSFGLLECVKADARNHVISSPNTSMFYPSSCDRILTAPQRPLLNPLAWVFPAPPRRANSSLKSPRGCHPETVPHFSPSASPQPLTVEFEPARVLHKCHVPVLLGVWAAARSGPGGAHSHREAQQYRWRSARAGTRARRK